MSVESTLDALFGADAALVALVGANRGVNGRLPKDCGGKPALSWQRIGMEPTADLTSGGDLDDVRVQIDAWADTPEQAEAVARRARDLLAPAAPGGLARLATWDGPSFSIEDRIWRVRTDYFIWQERN